MPELTVIHIALLVAATVIGAIVGSVIRSKRAEQEKAAIGASWQEQIDAQRKEHDRLLDQNKGLMEQVSQFQASTTDAKNRAKELSSAVQEAFERRDELQREIKDIRSNLETALSQRDRLQTDIAAKDADTNALRERDVRIEKLSAELENWQNRLPPLIERFRERNADAERLEAELAEAQTRIRELEDAGYEIEEEHTRIEPVTDPEELTDGLDASNDPAEEFVEETEPEDADELVDAEDILEEDDLIADNDDTSVAQELAENDDASMVDEEAPANDEPESQDFGSEDPEDMPTNEPSHNGRDDLKQIKGVGPAIEKTLNEMGIFSFRQIAEMSEYDIDRVAQRLKGFRSRIYREDWIGQARELRDQAVRA